MPANARRSRRLRALGSYAILTFLALIVLFPIYITVVNSLLRPLDIGARPPNFFPLHPKWSSYADAWNDGHMSRYILNSVIVTLMITVGQVVTAVFAGYAFAFCEFPFLNIAIWERDGARQLDLKAGRYVDRWERRGGEWRIAYRIVANDSWGSLDLVPGGWQSFEF